MAASTGNEVNRGGPPDRGASVGISQDDRICGPRGARRSALKLSHPARKLFDPDGSLGVTRQQLYNVIAGRSGITPEMSSRLEKGVGSTADAWLGMQAAYDLAQLRRSESLLI